MFETERLIIRDFNIDDYKSVYECCNDYDIVKMTLTMPWPYTEDMAKDWINSQSANKESGKCYEFAICFKGEPDKVIGCIALVGIDSRANRAELGYWIGKKYWKQGIATEAAKFMLKFGFEKLGLHSIFARYFDINPASGRVMAKSGMTYVWTMREYECRFGKYHNVGYYEMIASDLKN